MSTIYPKSIVTKSLKQVQQWHTTNTLKPLPLLNYQKSNQWSPPPSTFVNIIDRSSSPNDVTAGIGGVLRDYYIGILNSDGSICPTDHNFECFIKLYA